MDDIIINAWPVPRTSWISGYYEDDHRALDFGVMLNTPICACADGKVVKIGELSTGYGIYCKIQHAGYTSIYAHLSRYIVAVGDEVRAGDLIGYSGETGNSTGPHLHFETRLGLDNQDFTSQFDPLPYLQRLGNSIPAVTPSVGQYEIIVGGMRIRGTPMISDNEIGLARAGARLSISEVKDSGGYVWGKAEVWIAMKSDTNKFMRKIEE